MRGQSGFIATSSTHSAAFFIAVAAAALLVSCGLPTADYLYPPAYFDNTGASQLILDHNTGNAYADNGFTGYAIYYRAFDDLAKATSSYNSINTSISSSNIKYISSSYGYYPLLKINSTDSTKYDFSPLITSAVCESGSYVRFFVNMSNSSIWILQGMKSSDSTIVNIASIVRDKNTSYLPSQADFSISNYYANGDQDYDGSSNPSNVYFVFFAVACGTSSSSLLDIYSNPSDSSANTIILQSEPYNPLNSSP